MKKFFIKKDSIWRNSLEFYMYQKMENGKAFAMPSQMKFYSMQDEVNLPAPDPFFALEYEEAQNLMDALWDSGLRPSEGSGSAGSLAATERHLKDMRALVFKKKVEK